MVIDISVFLIANVRNGALRGVPAGGGRLKTQRG